MPFLSFTPNQQDRATYGLAPNLLKNMFVEATPGGPTGDARMSRGGLKVSFTAGDGPIRGIYQSNGGGFIGSDVYTVSDTEVYQNAVKLGDIAFGSRARMAGSISQLVIVQGGNAYCWDGFTLTQITDPDLPPQVYDVAYLAGRFIYSFAATDVFYWSDIGDATSIDGFAFASAESSPDAIEAIGVLSDDLGFFGQRTTEWWTVTADPDAPYQRTVGRSYNRGIIGQGTLQYIDNALMWVGDDRVVYRTGNVPVRVSNATVEEAIRKSENVTDATSMSMVLDGHSYYVANLLNSGSYCLDVSNNTWVEWTSPGQQQFRCDWNVLTSSGNLLGDKLSGKVFLLDPETYVDDTSSPIERVASMFFPVSGNFVFNSAVMLQCRRGVGNPSAPNPLVSLRYSDDAGVSWTNAGTRSLGTAGSGKWKAVWRRLGRIPSPGRLYEFSCSANASVVFEGVSINEGRP